MPTEFHSVRGITDLDLPGQDGHLLSSQHFGVLYDKFSGLLTCHVNQEKQLFLIQKINEQSKIAFEFVNNYEFILNEIRFEMRKIYNRSKFTEKEILDTWTKQVIDRTSEDNGLDFYNMVLKFRKERY